MVFDEFQSGDSSEESMEKMREFFSPAQIDQSIRHAITHCWMMLPKERKNTDELEHQIRRLVERALKDFREDSEQFGRSK